MQANIKNDSIALLVF